MSENKTKEVLPRSPGNFLTKSKAFKNLVSMAFDLMDRDAAGEVGQTELYAGLLFVHLKLAKYAGAAACFPPSRATVDKLFEAADKNKSNGIDKDEFALIIRICCSQILFRMLCYYAILILLVPIIAAKLVDYFVMENGSYLEMATEQITSTVLFYVAIPLLWNFIDSKSTQAVATSEVLTEAPAPLKKED